MAQPLHDHDHERGHTHSTTVVEERETGSPAGVILAIVAAALIGFLIWLVAFSGAFDGDAGDERGPDVTIEQNDGGTTTDGGTTDGGTTDGGTTDGGSTGGDTSGTSP